MKRVPLEPGTEVSAAEAERLLLHKLEEEKESPRHALSQLVGFYEITEQYRKGLVCLGKLVALIPDVETKANYVLHMGQLMEMARDYPAAVRYYRKALALK